MLTRFDHAVIAVPNLDEGMERYRALGFAVSRGGRHPGHGTENAIIRFGLDYLELLAVADPREARASGINGRGIRALLETHHGGLAGYALASDDIAADAERLRAFGLPVEGPFGMRRERPDGTVLAWQLAIPGGTPWRRPWPFLIAWETPDAERLAREQPSAQPNGVRAVTELAVAVRDLEAAMALYERGLGLTLLERREHANLAAEGAQFAAGQTCIALLAPRDANGDGPVAQALRAEGEGLFSVRLAAPDLAETRRALAASSVPLDPRPRQPDELLIPRDAAAGARLLVRAAGG